MVTSIAPSLLLAAFLTLALCISKSIATNVGDSSLHYMYESVEAEHENVKLGVTGEIPKWLSGAKYQNGLGEFEGPNPKHPFKFNHQFDVMAMVYRWGVQNGEVTFSNKFIKSKYREESFNGIPPYRTFGTTTPPMDACTTLRVLMNLEGSMTRHGNLAVNLVNFNSAKSDHLLAISDSTGFMEVNMTTMDTIGLYSFKDELTKLENKKVGGAKLTTAHPQHLPNDDYMYSFSVDIVGNGMSAKLPHNIELFRVKRGGKDVKREIMLSIPIKDIAYMHSFATTPNFIILVEFPLFYNMAKAAVSTVMKNALDWDPKRQGTRIIVIDKNTWEVVKTVQAKQPMWAYHHINAWEEEEGGAVPEEGGGANNLKQRQQTKKKMKYPSVTMDIAAYKDSTHLEAWGTGPEFQNNTYFMPPSTVQRLSVATAPGDDTVTQTTFSTANLDMPQINRGYQGHKYKYTYALAASELGTHWNQLVKLNMETGEQVVWRKDDHWPSEPLFIPRPGGGEDEDDGVVICTVLGGAGYDVSYMLVLDAKTMTPLAEARAPIRIPAVVHGNWYDH